MQPKSTVLKLLNVSLPEDFYIIFQPWQIYFLNTGTACRLHVCPLHMSHALPTNTNSLHLLHNVFLILQPKTNIESFDWKLVLSGFPTLISFPKAIWISAFLATMCHCISLNTNFISRWIKFCHIIGSHWNKLLRLLCCLLQSCVVCVIHNWFICTEISTAIYVYTLEMYSIYISLYIHKKTTLNTYENTEGQESISPYSILLHTCPLTLSLLEPFNHATV